MINETGKKQTPRFRRMCVTMENYQNHGLDRTKIANAVLSLGSLEYACFDLEISDAGVPHCHLYVVFKNQRNVSTIKGAFGEFVHIEQARGTHEQCIAYCEKSGDRNADKKHTQVEGSFWETGERPVTKPDAKAKWAAVYELAKAGQMTALEILDQYPTLASQLPKIELLVERFKTERSKRQFRDPVTCLILYGETSTGKTTWAYERFGDSLYRVCDYSHPYDGYSGEAVLVYDEVDTTAEAIPLSSILQLTDKFPLGAALARRYNNLVPEFHTVVFISNESPATYYNNAPPKQWNAFLRRVDHIYRFEQGGKIIEEDKTIYERH